MSSSSARFAWCRRTRSTRRCICLWPSCPRRVRCRSTQTCADDEIRKNHTTTCTVTAQNNAFESTTVDLRSRVNHQLEITAADGADVTDGGRGAELLGEELSAAVGRHPVDRPRSVARRLHPAGGVRRRRRSRSVTRTSSTSTCRGSSSPARRTPASVSTPTATSSPAAAPRRTTTVATRRSPTRRGRTASWRRSGPTSTARVQPGIYAATLTDGVNTWIVIEWQVNVFGTTSNRHFQVWLGVNGVEDITLRLRPGRVARRSRRSAARRRRRERGRLGWRHDHRSADRGSRRHEQRSRSWWIGLLRAAR